MPASPSASPRNPVWAPTSAFPAKQCRESSSATAFNASSTSRDPVTGFASLGIICNALNLESSQRQGRINTGASFKSSLFVRAKAASISTPKQYSEARKSGLSSIITKSADSILDAISLFQSAPGWIFRSCHSTINPFCFNGARYVASWSRKDCLCANKSKRRSTTPRPPQNKKYLCAIGSLSEGSQTRSSPSALTS